MLVRAVASGKLGRTHAVPPELLELDDELLLDEEELLLEELLDEEVLDVELVDELLEEELLDDDEEELLVC